MVAYPLLILSVCLVVLAPLAVVGARTKSNHNQLSDLDPDRPSVVGANVVRRYFAVGELSPAVVLLDNPHLDFRSPQGARRLTRSIAACDRSTTSPMFARLPNLSAIQRAQPPDAGLLNRLAGQALNIAAESRYVSVRPLRQ